MNAMFKNALHLKTFNKIALHMKNQHYQQLIVEPNSLISKKSFSVDSKESASKQSENEIARNIVNKLTKKKIAVTNNKKGVIKIEAKELEAVIAQALKESKTVNTESAPQNKNEEQRQSLVQILRGLGWEVLAMATGEIIIIIKSFDIFD